MLRWPMSFARLAYSTYMSTTINTTTRKSAKPGTTSDDLTYGSVKAKASQVVVEQLCFTLWTLMCHDVKNRSYRGFFEEPLGNSLSLR
jgi:hypothetical protein